MDEILQIYRTYIFAAVNKESHINKNEKYTCSVCFYNAEYCNWFRTADYSLRIFAGSTWNDPR